MKRNKKEILIHAILTGNRVLMHEMVEGKSKPYPIYTLRKGRFCPLL